MYEPPSFTASEILDVSDLSISKGNVNTLARHAFSKYKEMKTTDLILRKMEYYYSTKMYRKITSRELDSELATQIAEEIRLRRLDQML